MVRVDKHSTRAAKAFIEAFAHSSTYIYMMSPFRQPTISSIMPAFQNRCAHGVSSTRHIGPESWAVRLLAPLQDPSTGSTAQRQAAQRHVIAQGLLQQTQASGRQ